ncbi:hypothetical protein ACXR0O_24895 [Verrucomicrobiota bacterium sgz303538]
MNFGPQDRIGNQHRSEQPPGLLAIFTAYCCGSPSEVQANAEQVMSTVIRASADKPWPQWHEWPSILPPFFVESFNKRLLADEDWDLDGWLYWLRPENRTWYWWSARVSGRDTLEVAVVVDGFPFAWGALEYLLVGCGAFYVEQSDAK